MFNILDAAIGATFIFSWQKYKKKLYPQNKFTLFFISKVKSGMIMWQTDSTKCPLYASFAY